MDLGALREFCRLSGIALTAEQVAAFLRYRESLYRVNETANVTRVPIEECEVRHFIDSLLVAEFCPVGARVLDLGSGPGLPAWPLACARRDLRVTALDGSGKGLRVLAECPLANLTVKQRRAEEVDERERYDVVTGRAIAPFEAQIEVSAAWARAGGAVVPFRTPKDKETIEKSDFKHLGLRLESIEERQLSDTGVVRVFPVYRKVKRTPREYPRTWAQIRASARTS